MSDLPLIDESPFHKLVSELDRMKRGKANERLKPHKLVLLLVVINLFDEDKIKENRIYFNDHLTSAFKNVFTLIGKKDDWCQPAPPFFHLRSSDFWKHKIIEGREDNYKVLKTSGGGFKRIIENIDYAYFSDYAYKVISDPIQRKKLRDHIISIINPE